MGGGACPVWCPETRGCAGLELKLGLGNTGGCEPHGSAGLRTDSPRTLSPRCERGEVCHRRDLDGRCPQGGQAFPQQGCPSHRPSTSSQREGSWQCTLLTPFLPQPKTGKGARKLPWPLGKITHPLRPCSPGPVATCGRCTPGGPHGWPRASEEAPDHLFPMVPPVTVPCPCAYPCLLGVWPPQGRTWAPAASPAARTRGSQGREGPSH